MTLQEIQQMESENLSQIHLLSEGIFWKAYERSAFALFSQLRPFKVSCRTAKSLTGEVLVSVGFPKSSEEKILEKLPLLSREEKHLIYGCACFTEKEFCEWKKHIVQESASAAGSRNAPDVSHKGTVSEELVASVTLEAYSSFESLGSVLCDKLRRFNIAERTPMDCFDFLRELKRMADEQVRSPQGL